MNATGTTEPASVARATSTASELAVLRKHRQRWLIPLTQVLVLAVFLGAWEWLSRVHFAGAAKPIVDPFLWSRPSKIAARVIEWLADGTIANNVFVTLLEAAAGFVFGTVLGVLIGFVLALSDFWSRVFNPFITALNSIPALVFAPIFFVIFGLGVESKIAIGSLVVFFLTFWNAYQGVREVNRDVYRNAQTLGATRGQMAWHVLLPSALSWILSSLRTAVGFAMVAAIVGEYLGSTSGLGYIIAQSEGAFDQTGMMAGLVVLSAFVVTVAGVVAWLERRLLKWKPPSSI
jgi:NitT/TauT family transport system permease protein